MNSINIRQEKYDHRVLCTCGFEDKVFDFRNAKSLAREHNNMKHGQKYPILHNGLTVARFIGEDGIQ